MPLHGALHLALEPDQRAERLGEVHAVVRRVERHCSPQVVVVNIAPDIGGSVVRLATSILAQLGKDFDLHHSGAASENWALADVWLRAHRTASLVILGAESLNASLWRKLVAQAASSGRGLLLVNGAGPLALEHRRLLNARQTTIVQMDREMFQEWADELLNRELARASHQAAAPTMQFPAVPRDDVPFFIETCHELLSAEDFKAVDAAYIQGFRDARAWLAGLREPLFEEQVGAFLLGLVGDVADVHEQLTRIRGAQAGFWRKGWLLKVRVDALIAAHRSAPAAMDRQHELRMLNGFVAPRVAALALLALRTRLPPARLAVLNADQLTNDCSTLDLGGETISFEPEESILLRAQILDAERNGHLANGPVFCDRLGRRMTPNRLQQTLRRAAVDTGLPLTQTWSPPVDRHHSHWMHRRGLSIQPLSANAGR